MAVIEPNEENIEKDAKPSSSNHQESSTRKTIIGVAWMLLASGFFVSLYAILKYGGHGLSGWELMLYRGIFQVVTLGPLWGYQFFRVYQNKRQDPQDADLRSIHQILMWALLGPKGVRKLVLVQGMLGGTLVVGIYISLQVIPLTNGNAIFNTSPVVTLLLAALFLNERFRMYRLIVAICTLCGVLLITRPTAIFPPDNSKYNGNNTMLETVDCSVPSTFLSHDCSHLVLVQLTGYMFAIVVPLSSALLSIVIRRISLSGKGKSVFHLSVWTGVGILITSGIGIVSGLNQNSLFDHDWKSWIVGLVAAFIGTAGILAISKGFEYISPSLANLIRGSELIATAVLQACLGGHPFRIETGFGIICIIFAGWLIFSEAKLKTMLQSKQNGCLFKLLL